MSTDWNIHCKTCNETHSFDDANNCEELMWLLIDNAEAIAGVCDLVYNNTSDITFKTYYGPICTLWFKEHCKHGLVPISEYGDFATREKYGN